MTLGLLLQRCITLQSGRALAALSKHTLLFSIRRAFRLRITWKHPKFVERWKRHCTVIQINTDQQKRNLISGLVSQDSPYASSLVGRQGE